MARVNPFELSRPEPVTETRDFTDVNQPGVTFTFTFKAEADYGLSLAAIDLGNTHIANYLPSKKGLGAPTLPVGGREVILTASLCRVIGALETLEKPPEGETKYSFHEWLALSAMAPNAFGEIAEWSGALMAKAAGNLKDDALPED